MYVVEHNQTAKPCDSGAVNKHNGFRITWAKDPTPGLKRWRKKFFACSNQKDQSFGYLTGAKEAAEAVQYILYMFTDSSTKGNSL